GQLNVYPGDENLSSLTLLGINAPRVPLARQRREYPAMADGYRPSRGRLVHPRLHLMAWRTENRLPQTEDWFTTWLALPLSTVIATSASWPTSMPGKRLRPSVSSITPARR